MKFKMYEVVRLTIAIPDCAVGAGAVGTVVMVYTDPYEAYEVEFCNEEGRTLELMAFRPEQLEAWPPTAGVDAS